VTGRGREETDLNEGAVAIGEGEETDLEHCITGASDRKRRDGWGERRNGFD